MQFCLLDRIIELDRGERIVAVKAVSLAEEYLADHFPTFPVLPGVLMLQAMSEAAGWLVYDAQDFAQSVVLLKSSRNVTYKSFVRPGQILRLEVQCRKMSTAESEFAGRGLCDDAEVVKGRFTMRHLKLADSPAGSAEVDEQIVASARRRFDLLRA